MESVSPAGSPPASTLEERALVVEDFSDLGRREVPLLLADRAEPPVPHVSPLGSDTFGELLFGEQSVR